MSFYFLIFVILTAGALLSWFRPQYDRYVYPVCWCVMTACLCLRFGQGVDYVTYDAIYDTIPAVIDLSQGYICGFFPEIGWRLLNAFFKALGAPFWVLTMVLGLLEMGLLHRFLKKYVQPKACGLFLFYPVLYMTYMVSGLRQGLAMCLFLGLLVPLYLEGKWVRYVLGVLLLTCFHRVSYAWLVLPAAYFLPFPAMLALPALSAFAGTILQLGAVEQFLTGLFPVYHLKQFLLAGEVSPFAVAERLVTFAVLLVWYLWRKRCGQETDRRTELIFKAYLCGVCFYMLLYGSSYYASRYAVAFKILEPALVLAFAAGRDRAAKFFAGFFFALTLLMGCKNLNAMIDESYYYQADELQIWNYPYVSVFNREDISLYFDYEKRLGEQYDANIGDQQLWRIE